MNNIKEGFGIYTTIDGTKYEGQYKNDNWNGQGKVTLADGTIY